MLKIRKVENVVASRIGLLLGALVLVLFPFRWLGVFWPAVGYWIDWVFSTELAHAIGHAIMFFILGMLLLVLFGFLRTRLRLYLGLMLLVGMGQECFQLLYKQRPWAYDDVRDLVVDMVACVLAFWIVWGWNKLRRSGHKPVQGHQAC